MFSPALFWVRVAQPLFVGLLAGGLAGCNTMGNGATEDATTTTQKPFTSYAGSVDAKGVVTQVKTNANTNAIDMTVQTGAEAATVQAWVAAPKGGANTQRVDLTVAGAGGFSSDSGLVESNGSSARGSASGTAGNWVTLTNSPGSSLNASLGAPSLEHSYAGVGELSKRAAGSTGDFLAYSYAFFGGKSATDMPTTGVAEYSGTFEGVEQIATTGASSMQTNRLSGTANLTADFGAKTVRGRIDDINRHGAISGTSGTGYSVGYAGAITGSSFTGTSMLTQKNTNLPAAGFSQNAGVLQGGFFGPGAAEAAGAVGVSAADANTKVLVTGGFGTKKK